MQTSMRTKDKLREAYILPWLWKTFLQYVDFCGGFISLVLNTTSYNNFW